MHSWSPSAALAVAATLGFLLSVGSLAHGESDCTNALATARADDLLGIPSRYESGFPLEVPIPCKWRGFKDEPRACKLRRVVVEDQMLDASHRLFVTRFNYEPPVTRLGPDSRPSRLAEIYACVDGRAERVYWGALHQGGKIESLGRGKFVESNSFLRDGRPVPYSTTYYWHARSAAYTDDPGVAPPPAKVQRIPCGELKTSDPERLIALPSAGDAYTHGFGLYDDGEFDITLVGNRMVSPDRRLVVVRRNHLKGAGALDDSRVFGCVAGSIKALFQVTDALVEAAPNDGLKVYIGGRYSPLRGSSGVEQANTYVWKPQLGDYVLTAVEMWKE